MPAVVSLSVSGLLVTPPCPWLPLDVGAKAALVVHEAHAAIGICEDPVASNRGAEVNQWNRDAGVPVGSYWCASFAGAMWKRAGLQVPAGYASCDVLLAWGKRTGRFSQHVPSLGALVFYGKGDDAHHVGIIVRTAPLTLSVEGNTSVESGYDRNGIAVQLKRVDEHDPVLGYVHIAPLP